MEEGGESIRSSSGWPSLQNFADCVGKLLWGLDRDYEGLSNGSSAIPTKKEQLPFPKLVKCKLSTLRTVYWGTCEG